MTTELNRTLDNGAVELGIAVMPYAQPPEHAVELSMLADDLGLDLVGIQDHPCRPELADTWSLLCYIGTRTGRIRLMPDVADLPMRPPAMLAKAAASLDLLTAGRVELGLGAGAFWDEIASMGGPARTKGESVDALAEAIAVIRAAWSGQQAVDFEGEHYRLDNLHPGPAPAHGIGIWVGAFGPRRLELTRRLADGWLPSVPPLAYENVPPQPRPPSTGRLGSPAAGRPGIRRMANLAELGEPQTGWAEKLARMTETLGFDGFFVAADDPDLVRRLGNDVAPRLRELTRGMRASPPCGTAQIRD
jgi:alkanesulfonate monooxygenase SsuD/methylene tetrahydromethanopterin reductase-like flavin-dependent oxidoreductase (luciferase family)